MSVAENSTSTAPAVPCSADTESSMLAQLTARVNEPDRDKIGRNVFYGGKSYQLVPSTDNPKIMVLKVADAVSSSPTNNVINNEAEQESQKIAEFFRTHHMSLMSQERAAEKPAKRNVKKPDVVDSSDRNAKRRRVSPKKSSRSVPNEMYGLNETNSSYLSDDDDVSVHEQPAERKNPTNKKRSRKLGLNSTHTSALPNGAYYDKNGYVIFSETTYTKRLQAGSELYPAASRDKDYRRQRHRHTRRKRVRCNYCHQILPRFGIQEHVMRHLDVGLMPFACDQCEGRFPTNDKLKRHVDVAHNQIKSYQCSECAYFFSCQTNLRVHRNTQAHKDVVAGISKPKPQQHRTCVPKHLLNSRKLERFDKLAEGEEWTALPSSDDDDGNDDSSHAVPEEPKPKKKKLKRAVPQSVNVTLPVKIYRENYCHVCNEAYTTKLRSHKRTEHHKEQQRNANVVDADTSVDGDDAPQPLNFWKQIQVDVQVSSLWKDSTTLDAVYEVEKAEKRRCEQKTVQTKFDFRDVHTGCNAKFDLSKSPFDKLNLLSPNLSNKNAASQQLILHRDQWGHALKAIADLDRRAAAAERQLQLARQMMGDENYKVLTEQYRRELELEAERDSSNAVKGTEPDNDTTRQTHPHTTTAPRRRAYNGAADEKREKQIFSWMNSKV